MISVQEEWAGIQIHESSLAAISLAISRESHKVFLGVRIHCDQLCWILSLVGEWSIHELKALEVQYFQVNQLRGFFEIHQEVDGTAFLEMEVVGMSALISKFIEVVNRSRAEVHISELKRAVTISVSLSSSSLHSFVEGLWVLVLASSSSSATLRYHNFTSYINFTLVSSEIERASVFGARRVNVVVPAVVSDVCNLVVDIDVWNLFDWLLLFLASQAEK